MMIIYREFVMLVIVARLSKNRSFDCMFFSLWPLMGGFVLGLDVISFHLKMG